MPEDLINPLERKPGINDKLNRAYPIMTTDLSEVATQEQQASLSWEGMISLLGRKDHDTKTHGTRLLGIRFR